MIIIQGLCGRGRIPRGARNVSREMEEGEDRQGLPPLSRRLPPDATGLRRALQGQHEKAGAKGNGAAASMLKTEPKGLAPNKSSNQWITRPVLGLVS